nr:hypothetical protein [Tanacetum cinerariifolium]
MHNQPPLQGMEKCLYTYNGPTMDGLMVFIHGLFPKLTIFIKLSMFSLPECLEADSTGFAAALAVLVTGASQSRQHGRSESGFAAALAVLVTGASQSRQHGRSESNHKDNAYDS